MTSRRLAGRLASVSRAYQLQEIVPRCGSCEKPCCRLDELVLELDWERLRALWGWKGSRRDFDRVHLGASEASGLRAEGGLYYLYRSVCPAYDERERRCRVYAGELKPPGCTDFPVYEEEGLVTADLRCGAVDLARFEAFAFARLGPEVGLDREVDPRFPFLVRYRAQEKGSARGEGGRGRAPAGRSLNTRRPPAGRRRPA